MALLTGHVLTERKREAHYFKGIAGNNVAPITSLPGAELGHDHEGRDHGNEMPFEGAGTFSTPESSYSLTVQAVDGTYAAPGMKVVVFAALAGSEAELHIMEAEAEHSFEQAGIDIQAGGTMMPAEDTGYQLHFDESVSDSVSGAPVVALFAEHSPTEVERVARYFKGIAGMSVERELLVRELLAANALDELNKMAQRKGLSTMELAVRRQNKTS